MTSLAGSAPRRRHSFWTRLAAVDDGAIIRFAFFAMLVGTAAVLFIDYRELTESAASGFVAPEQPILPAFDPDGTAPTPGPAVTTDPEALRAPLAIALGSDGVLSLTGTIDVGAAARFAAELEARGEYVTTVALNSPGGSVVDALEIATRLRERGYATSVAAGALCASSCPLVLAAGSERHADAAAAIGVHQVYAQTDAGNPTAGLRAAGDAMSDAQQTTALITRHLDAMGVDPALWLHALETPPTRLYYLTSKELQRYRLATVDPEP
jgi:hypothetical protein